MSTTDALYGALLEALAERRADLELSQLGCDDVTGLASGYTGKVESQVRVPSAALLVEMFQAVGLRLVPTPIPNWQASKKLAEHMGEGRRRREQKAGQRRCGLPAQMQAA